MFTIWIKLFTDSSDNGNHSGIANKINFVQYKKTELGCGGSGESEFSQLRQMH
jgi:hypothetical protein